ncbi:hypothetical protein BKA62DRAFT_833556 [Auriculariales sp. MPI-PUGE-AT-0066]|nr:hypothetical protein BKA62DRAFT_833556 [Auriculariales sp. MPI-PUGE-AT-0066]
MSVAAPYNLALSAASPLFTYLPDRDGSQITTWNASYTGQSLWPPTADTNLPAGIAYRGTNSARASPSANKGRPDRALQAYGNEATAVYIATNLANGKHKAFLQVSANGGQEFRFFGGGVTLAVDTNGKVVDDSQNVDDHDPNWVFTPSTGAPWDKGGKGPTLFDNTVTFQCNYGSDKAATYIFSGANGVVLKGNVWIDAHEFSIVLDGVTTNMDATSSWNDGSTVFYAKTGLDPAQSHTISLVDYNSDVGPNCFAKRNRFCCTGLDVITLLKAGSQDLPPTSTGNQNDTSTSTKTNAPGQTAATTASSSNVGAIAGGVVGGIFAALAIVALAWFCIRRRRRDQEDDRPAYNPGGVGQQMHTDQHAARPAFFPPATSYAPSIAQSGHGAIFGAGSVAHSNSTAPQQYGGMQQVVHQMSPTTSMYSQQPVQQPGTHQLQQQQQQQSPAWMQPVAATGDRKVRAGFGAGGAAASQQSNPSSLYGGAANGSAPQLVQGQSAGSNSSGVGPYGGIEAGGQQPADGPRLGQHDLEQVLQFIAQRMDRPGGGAPSSGGARSEVGGDDLPTYQR